MLICMCSCRRKRSRSAKRRPTRHSLGLLSAGQDPSTFHSGCSFFKPISNVSALSKVSA